MELHSKPPKPQIFFLLRPYNSNDAKDFFSQTVPYKESHLYSHLLPAS